MKIAVIGAGIMGTSISQCLLMNNFSVEIVDKNKNQILKAKETIENGINQAIQKKLTHLDDYKKIITNLSPKDSVYDLSKDNRIIIECINEDFTIKSLLYEHLNKAFEKYTPILLTNTSCLSINDLSQNYKNPEAFLGMHFFYPAEKNKLVELIPHSKTDSNILDIVLNLSYCMGKYPIIVKDTPGFSINRFFVPFLNESVSLLEQYPDYIDEINEAAKIKFGSPYGAFDIMNLTGSRLACEAICSLYNKLGYEFKPPKLLLDYSKTNQKWHLNAKDPAKYDQKMIIYFANILQNNVSKSIDYIIRDSISTIDDIRVGMRLGLAWKKPVDNFVSPEIISKSQVVMYNKTKDIARIRLCKPESLNCLDQNLFIELNEKIESAMEDKSINMITLEGYPKVFCAGADLKFFIKCLENNDFESIDKYNELAHRVLIKLSTSAKPVIAMVDGISIGGGAELALSCNYIITTSRATFSFPETTIGLFPAFGGSQRLPKKVGTPWAKKLILNNYNLNFEEAHKINFSDFLFLDTQLYYNLWGQSSLFISELINSKKKENLIIDNKDDIIDFNISIIPGSSYDTANRLIDLSSTISLSEGLKLEREEIMKLFKRSGLIDKFKSLFQKDK